MKTVHSMKDMLDRKNGAPCPVCSRVHKPQEPCSREAMAFKIAKLTEANAMIPAILEHNKEATTLAEGLRLIVKKADESHALLMEVLAGHGEVGKQIQNEYLEKLDKWAKNHASTNPDTSEQLSLFDQEKSTSKETEPKDSTTTPSGGPSAPASSQ